MFESRPLLHVSSDHITVQLQKPATGFCNAGGPEAAVTSLISSSSVSPPSSEPLSNTGQSPKARTQPKNQCCFFILKIYSPKNDLFCYSLGKYLCPVNIGLIFLKKIYDIFMILVDFCVNFPQSWLIFANRIWIRLTKIKRIQTDPDPQHCGTLY